MPTRKAKYQLFDPLRGEEYAALEADIAARGVMVPVEVDENGDTLDGHHRQEIADRLGKPYKTIVRRFKSEGEKREHVIKLNLARRHLEPWQWGLAFKRLLEERGAVRGKGGDRKSKAKVALDTVEDVSREIGVPVDTAKKRLAQADAFESFTAKEQSAVREREKTVAQVRRERKEAQREKERAKNREKINAAPTLATALKAATFSTLVVDPPWDWGDEGDVDQLGRSRPTYDTIPIDELHKHDLKRMAAADCHLYLWITNRSLPKGFALLESWGFRYVTCLTWCKPSFGMGNYFRGSTEQILFGVRGSLPLKRKDAGTWFQAARGKEHSAKPSEFYELVESCSHAPYLDVFARQQREGWTCWGGEL